MAFIGVDFTGRTVKAVYDGAYHEYNLGDGILWGMGITITPDAVHIAKGMLIMAGRRVYNDGSMAIYPENLVDGYMRIRMQIDLNRAASKTEFEQLSVLQDFQQTTQFPALTQTDINNDVDNIYEIELGVFQLSGGSIVSTVRTIAAAPSVADLYSYNETRIGTWLGKPLYQKVINMGNLPNNADKNVAIGTDNLDLVVNITGVAIPPARAPVISLPYVQTTAITANVPVWMQDFGYIRIRTAIAQWTQYTGYVVVQYTKTTD